MYFLPSFHAIFTSYLTLICTDDETSQNWMVTFGIAEIRQQFCATVFFPITNIKQIYAAVWHSDVMHQRVISENINKTL